jgi:hypothetical protein
MAPNFLSILGAWCFAYLRALGLITFCSDSPNYDGINKAAEANADIAREALQWYRDAYKDQAPAREAASARAAAVSDSQMRAMDTQTRLAQEADDYNKGTFRPLERKLVAESQQFDTEAQREELAGKALGDVRQSFAAARDIGIRDLTRRGVNPNDGNYGSVAKQLALGEAAAGAGAATKAREDAITLGRALKMDAVSLGRGLPSQQATATSLALNAGNSSANNAQTPLQIAQNATNQAGQGYNTAIQGNNSAGNLYGSVARMQGSEDDAMWGAIGNVAGKATSAFIMSDKNQKTGRKRMSGEEAITLARKMPVDKWKYKDGSPAADGGREHVGPMAQDAHAAGGDGLAPGGKMLHVGDGDPDMVGITLAAVKNVDKRLARLEKRVA